MPPGAGPTEISKIAFDEQGRMVLAERPAPTGAFDFEALTPQGIGRVLRYANTGTDPNAELNWQPVPDEYAIGFPLDLRNGNGGVDIGYLYKPNGDIDLQNCGGYLWSTGEQLRKSPDASLAARLRQSGPEIVDGLQGNGTWRIRRGDEPPLLSYFIDYDDRFDDDAARGHMGDVAIALVCTPRTARAIAAAIVGARAVTARRAATAAAAGTSTAATTTATATGQLSVLDRSSAVEPASVFAAGRTCWSAVSAVRRRTSRPAANARARLAAPDKHRSVRAMRAATIIRSIRIPAAPRRAAKTASSSTANASRKRRNARPVRRTRNAAPAMC